MKEKAKDPPRKRHTLENSHEGADSVIPKKPCKDEEGNTVSIQFLERQWLSTNPIEPNDCLELELSKAQELLDSSRFVLN